MSPRRMLPRLVLLSLLSLPALVRAAPDAGGGPAGAALKRYEAIMDEAAKAAKKGDHAGALTAYDRALAIRPNDQAALTDQGWSAFQLHALDRAEAITRRAIAAAGDPRRTAAAQYNLGRILEERGNKAGAVAAYQESLKLRPNRAVSARLASLDPAASGFSTDTMEDLDESQKAQIIKLLAAGGFPHGPVIGKAWPRREKTYLVAGLEDPDSERHPHLHVVAFDLSGPSVRKLASGAEPFVLGRDDTLAGFDLAAYRLTAKEYAFGVRISRNRGYGGGTATLENLIVFRVNGKAIEEILRTVMSYEADLAGNWNEDGTRDREGSSGKTVLLVRQHKTHGYFDWALKDEGGPTTTLVWEKNSYELKSSKSATADSGEDNELEIFNDD
jgi:tetratricopeptide (TPR) repeat protein